MPDRGDPHTDDQRTDPDAPEVLSGRDVPETPTDLPGTSWWAAVRRAVGEFRRDNVTDWAAALPYYGVLSIFPAMLVIVSLVGLAGKSVSQSLITNVGELAPGQVKEI